MRAQIQFYSYPRFLLSPGAKSSRPMRTLMMNYLRLKLTPLAERVLIPMLLLDISTFGVRGLQRGFKRIVRHFKSEDALGDLLHF